MTPIFSYFIDKMELYNLTEMPEIIQILDRYRMCRWLKSKPEKKDYYNTMIKSLVNMLKNNNVDNNNVLEFIANNLVDILETCKEKIANCERISINLQMCGKCSIYSINLQTCEDCRRLMNLHTIKNVITNYNS